MLDDGHVPVGGIGAAVKLPLTLHFRCEGPVPQVCDKLGSDEEMKIMKQTCCELQPP